MEELHPTAEPRNEDWAWVSETWVSETWVSETWVYGFGVYGAESWRSTAFAGECKTDRDQSAGGYNVQVHRNFATLQRNLAFAFHLTRIQRMSPFRLKPIPVPQGHIDVIGILHTIATGFALLPSMVVGEEPINFARDIRPLLSDRCFVCHGPDSETREADLRLDLADSAYESVIVPGNPDESEFVARISSDDPDLLMPPPDSNLKLSETEREQLRRWVQSGANYSRHWAFESLRPAQASAVTPESLQPIDALVREELSNHPELQPAARADAATLIRRLCFDLTGLPPTREEVQAFVAAFGDGKSPASEIAYEALVDRLLASQRFGERMAVDWLDVARYADTYGYQNDRYRPMWPWRDWVVKAFNDNLSFDQFITWQIAGDLLPNPSREQILATAFNRNHRQTNEGGSVEEEFRAEYVADRVNTVGAAFLGLTLECCRCHDHKYDPITQREYYQLAAFFNSIDESGLYSHFTQATPTPTLSLAEQSQEDQLHEIQLKIENAEQRFGALRLDDAQFLNWRRSLRDVRPPQLSTPGSLPNPSQSTSAALTLRTVLNDRLSEALIGDFPFDDIDASKVVNRVSPDEPGKLTDAPRSVPGKVKNGLAMSGDNNVVVSPGGDFSRNQPFSISIWIKPTIRHQRAVIFHRSRAWSDSGSRGYELLIEEGKLSAALIHFWPGNAIRVIAEDDLPIGNWSHVTMTYDGSSRADGLELFVNGDPVPTTIVRDHLTRHIKGADGFGGGDAKDLAIGQRFRDMGFKQGQVDEFKVFNRRLTPLESKYLFVKDALPHNLNEVLYNTREEQLRELFLSAQPDYIALGEELTDLRNQRSQLSDSFPEIMVMREMETPRTTYILTRGAYDAPADIVQRGVPAQVLPLENSHELTRLDLAAWLVDPKHPLTARVAVNRFWQMMFGQGLVTTAEDFGLQGSLPSNPELLDWLANEFIASGWNTKQLLKTIVMSQTYQQQSNPTPVALKLDPENRYLSRGPSIRLPAEMIRDGALFASGLLVEKLGGEPTKPYQPDGLWKEKSGQQYKRDIGEGCHRRSLYTYWKRTSPPPAMMTLDASNREVCVVKRQVTMTPMQMLVLLNDPQYVEAAKALAHKAYSAGATTEERLQVVFESLVSRTPSGAELQVLTKMYQEQLGYFVQTPKAAQELLSVGDFKTDPSLPPSDISALTIVAEALMTYDETVMKR